jgi:rhamnosyl/mannosyltransferase
MHVCHLTKYYPPATGGIESHVQTLAKRQVELGLKVSVLCVDHLHRSGDAARSNRCSNDEGVQVVRVPRSASVSKWDYCPGLSRQLQALQVGPDACDLLHLHTPNPTMTLALRRARPTKPYVVTFHSDVIKQRFLGAVLNFVESPLLKNARRILATSPNYAAGSAVLKRFSDNVEVLPLGIELSPLLTPSAESLRHRDHLLRQYPGPIWLSVGRLVYYKGLDVAIRALPKIPGRLIIVGEGPLRTEWQRLAEACGCSDRVVWLGNVDAQMLTGAYHAATALLFPSNARSEGFGLVQVEAMACGCPVINTRIPDSGVAWVSPHEDSGLTVPINDPDALAQAALQILEDPELRNRFSASGVLRAQEMFDARMMAERSFDVYRRALRTDVPQVSRRLIA